MTSGSDRGSATSLVRYRLGCGCRMRPRTEQLRGVLQLVVGPRLRRGSRREAVRLRTRRQAQSAAVALREVEENGGQPGCGVDLGAQRDAVLRARLDAATAPLAELGEQERFRPFADFCHLAIPPRGECCGDSAMQANSQYDLRTGQSAFQTRPFVSVGSGSDGCKMSPEAHHDGRTSSRRFPARRTANCGLLRGGPGGRRALSDAGTELRDL